MKEAREIIAAKIGSLTIANIELATSNKELATLCKSQAAEIAELKAKLEKPATPTDNLPSNPYEGEKAANGVH